MLFLAHFHYYMKDILYITLKVQAAQNISMQNDLTWKKKQKQTGPLLPAEKKSSL